MGCQSNGGRGGEGGFDSGTEVCPMGIVESRVAGMTIEEKLDNGGGDGGDAGV